MTIVRGWQLLVDTYLLSDWWKVDRVQDPVEKFEGNPIIQPDLPWEPQHTYGSFPTGAMYDETDGTMTCPQE